MERLDHQDLVLLQQWLRPVQSLHADKYKSIFRPLASYNRYMRPSSLKYGNQLCKRAHAIQIASNFVCACCWQTKKINKNAVGVFGLQIKCELYLLARQTKPCCCTQWRRGAFVWMAPRDRFVYTSFIPVVFKVKLGPHSWPSEILYLSTQLNKITNLNRQHSQLIQTLGFWVGFSHTNDNFHKMLPKC